jgi:hypothetical protein
MSKRSFYFCEAPKQVHRAVHGTVIKEQEAAFLRSDRDRDWKADLDCSIADDQNVIRVFEGRYDTGARASPGNSAATMFDKIQKEREERHGRAASRRIEQTPAPPI